MAGWWKQLKTWLTGSAAQAEPPKKVPLQGYDHDLKHFRVLLGHAPDFTMREFRLGVNGSKVAALYLKSLADEARVANEIIMPLSGIPNLVEGSAHTTQLDTVRNLLTCGTVTGVEDREQALHNLLHGQALLLVGGAQGALAVDTRAVHGRTVVAPEIEMSVFGPKVAFVEDCEVNLSLIRQQVRTPALRIESFTIGERNPRRVFMLYIADLATEETVDRLRVQLESIRVSALLQTNYLQSFLGISPWSPFPQAIHSERPDRVSGNLLEGRITLLLDGSPEAIVLPMGFSDLFQSPGDYYDHYLLTSLMRTFRLLAFLIATTLPALYVAIVSYNYELLPTDVLFAVATARAGIPFPPSVEALLMMVIIDILQEGTLRIPSKIGQTVGVVGGFVLGQAVILARLVSPLMVIVIAIATISSFAAPDYRLVGLTRLLRYALLVGASILSGVGIAAVWTAIIIHLASLEVLGVAYLRPIAPLRLSSLSDLVYRQPYHGATQEQARRVKLRT